MSLAGLPVTLPDSVLFGRYEGVDAVPLTTEVNGSVLNADGITTPAAANR
jgi:hypothetical protein